MSAKYDASDKSILSLPKMIVFYFDLLLTLPFLLVYRGRMDWEDGSWYEGEFVHGRFEGYVLLLLI